MKTLVMSLPVAARALVLFAALIAGGAFLYNKFAEPAPKTSTPTGVTGVTGMTNNVIIQTGTAPPGHQYAVGQLDANHSGADHNPQNIEAEHKALEDTTASAWHIAHKADDDPPDVPLVPQTDPDNCLYYRYYAKSDHCIFIDRRQNGVDHTHWVKDPMSRKHEVDVSLRAAIESSPAAGGAFTLAKLFELPAHLIPVALAATFDRPMKPAPVQSNYCVNPHQGQFKYWWGNPLDQCNSPMYRQFADGCTHYQLYNRCASSWDSRIFWLSCHPPPHY
jgi:hypothetical protein